MLKILNCIKNIIKLTKIFFNKLCNQTNVLAKQLPIFMHEIHYMSQFIIIICVPYFNYLLKASYYNFQHKMYFNLKINIFNPN
jgi:hypothetical protein